MQTWNMCAGLVQVFQSRQSGQHIIRPLFLAGRSIKEQRLGRYGSCICRKAASIVSRSLLPELCYYLTLAWHTDR